MYHRQYASLVVIQAPDAHIQRLLNENDHFRRKVDHRSDLLVLMKIIAGKIGNC